MVEPEQSKRGFCMQKRRPEEAVKHPKRNLFVSAFAVLTVGVMVLFFNLYEPWRPSGPELIPDGSFSSPGSTNGWSGWNSWTQRSPDGGFGGSPGVVLTCSSTEHGTLRFTDYNLTDIPAFRVSMRASATGVLRGKEGYHVPRAIFFYHDAKAKGLFGFHHGLMDISKDTGWQRYKGFFPVPKGAVDARLHIQNLGVAGVMRIDDVSVIPVCPRPSAAGWNILFGTLWMAAFGLCLFALNPWKRQYGFLITLTLFLIMIGIVLPGQILDGGIQKTEAVAKRLLTKPPPAQAVNVSAPTAVPKEEIGVTLTRKAVEKAHLTGHLTLFSLLAFFSALSWLITPQLLHRAGTVYAGLTLFAAATEVLQFMTPDRSAALSDLYVDMSGMAGAVVLAFLLRSIQRLINRD